MIYITRSNIDELLDNEQIAILGDRGEVNGEEYEWYFTIQRNGKTKRWKKSSRIRVPIRAGKFRMHSITEEDFNYYTIKEYALDPEIYRVREIVEIKTIEAYHPDQRSC
jgi:hypothetical protein